jgi:UDP-N-acetylmuramoyl-L-alanyl-D-glutamate--2,6-diaminopimelate ligase
MNGMKGGRAKLLVEPDRRRAIRTALTEARPGDVVVLAGKGHETYQEIGRERILLDERAEVAAWFDSAGKTG